jgi:hypothetical protein
MTVRKVFRISGHLDQFPSHKKPLLLIKYGNVNMTAVIWTFIGRCPDFLTNISCVNLWFQQE